MRLVWFTIATTVPEADEAYAKPIIKVKGMSSCSDVCEPLWGDLETSKHGESDKIVLVRPDDDFGIFLYDFGIVFV